MVNIKATKRLIKKTFHDTIFLKKLLTIALPIIIQNFIASSINMVDTLMIGKVGETEIAAVGIANQFFFLFNILNAGIFSGCGIFISQFWGKKDTKNIRRIVGISLFAAILISIVFTGVAIYMPKTIIAVFNKDPKVIYHGSLYLKTVSICYILSAVSFSYAMASRCIGNPTLPMMVSFASLICNAVLNYILIFGKMGFPAMGVVGAAIATIIARFVETTLLVSYIYIRQNVLAANFKEMTDITLGYISKVAKTVIPVVLNELCWGLGAVVYSIVYGHIGTQAIASVQICTTVQNFFMIVTFGISNAATVMIGNKIGEGDIKTGKLYAKRFALLSICAGVFLGLSLFLSSKTILSFFNISDTVFYNSLMILQITSIILPIRIFNVVLIVGILRGGGDARFSLIAEAFTMWIIGVPLAFVGAFFFKLPVYYVVALVMVEEVVKFILGFSRLTSDKWIRSVIEGIH